MTFQRPDPVGAKPAQRDAPDTVELLAATLDEWQHRRQSSLPTPLPMSSREAAKWWLSTMQEPEVIGETRRIQRGDSTYWHLGYFTRTRQAMLNFLRLDRTQRETVIAAVEDGIPYRGDDWEVFLRIIRETEKMREIGVAEYRAKSLAAFRSLMQDGK